MWFILIFSLLMFTAFIVDMPSMINLLVIYSIGSLAIKGFGGENKNNILKIYYSVLTAGGIYMLISYVYMMQNNYDFLLSPDISYYFLPTTQTYLSESNIINSTKLIWSNYDIFNRFQPGYFTYATLFGYISKWLGANFYFGQQISVLLVYSFVGVMIYKLFILNRFHQRQAYKYTLIICTFSIIYFYSSQVLRDTHILLLYLAGIYFTFKKKFSFKNLSKIIATIVVCSTFRIESGMFLIILVPTYLMLTLQASNKKFVAVFITGVIGIAGIATSLIYFSEISYIVESNHEAYSEDLGSGIIGNLQRVPVIGQLASIVYNAVQPVPFWSRFVPSNHAKWGHEVYNIMNFPRSFASFFNLMVIVFMFYWISSRRLQQKTKIYISRPLRYHLWIGLVFLFLQSAVISQRRLMPYYCIFYILFFIIINTVCTTTKNYLLLITIVSFLLIQIGGMIILNL